MVDALQELLLGKAACMRYFYHRMQQPRHEHEYRLAYEQLVAEFALALGSPLGAGRERGAVELVVALVNRLKLSKDSTDEDARTATVVGVVVKLVSQRLAKQPDGSEEVDRLVQTATSSLFDLLCNPPSSADTAILNGIIELGCLAEASFSQASELLSSTQAGPLVMLGSSAWPCPTRC